MSAQKPVIHLKRVQEKHYDTKSGHATWSFGKAIRWDAIGASHWMRGPCPNCGSPTSNYGGGWSCHSDYCPSSANIFACSAGPAPIWWETEIDVFKDGDQWCATMADFINLQESPAGFGDTPAKAVQNLADNLNCTFEKAPLAQEG